MSERWLPYGRQTIEEDDVAAVARVLRSDFLTTGPEVEAFEKELAASCGVKHAVAVANGTAALHAAYAAAGVGPGDEVVTSPLTFSATANMALALGARPVFADVLESTLCLDPEAVERALTPRTKVVAPVDFAGNPADMDRLTALAERHGLLLVEDASHSVGGFYRGRPVGSLAHLTTLSFHPVKTITTGEGGAVLTSDDGLAERARDFRNHGLVRDRTRLARYDGPWYYEIQSLGFNYRLSDIHAALGRSQLAKLGRFVARRRALVARYREGLVGCPRIRFAEETPGAEPAWHLMAVVLEGPAALRREVYARLEQQRIRPQVHYILVSDFPLYRQLGHDPQATPVAAAAAERLLSLPLFPSLTDEDVDRVIAALREVLG
jgi:perosamine synthetase